MPSIFTLEALAAKHGDALLLHWGPSTAPRLAVIDGGPRGVWSLSLRKRLEELRAERGTPLSIALGMVSHVDDDHIQGLLDLTAAMEKDEDEGRPAKYQIDEFYLNAFDDIVGNAQVAAFSAVPPPTSASPAAAVVASVGQGRALRDRLNRLGLSPNGDGKLLLGQRIIEVDEHLKFEILAPSKTRMEEFQEAWDKEVKKRGWAAGGSVAEIAAYLDTSPWNLASLVVLARSKKKTMLLTGDARGDDILAGLADAGHEDGIAIDLLKVPHHGSDRNVSTDFFRKVLADHYVISGNGEHQNPDLATLEMILDARGSADYTIHLTYRDGVKELGKKLDSFLKGLTVKQRKRFVFRKAFDLSLSVALIT